MKNLLFALSFAAILAGCSSTGNHALENPDKLNAIVENRTTVAEVRSLLGEPAFAAPSLKNPYVVAYRLAKSNLIDGTKLTSVILHFRDGIVVAKDVNTI